VLILAVVLAEYVVVAGPVPNARPDPIVVA